MKKFISLLIILMTFSLQGMINYNKYTEFYAIENRIAEDAEIVERGIRLTYITDLDLQREKNRIEEFLNNIDSNLNIEYYNGYFLAKDNNTSITVSLWNESNNVNVSIDYVTTGSSMTLQDLQSVLEPLVNNECKNERYFLNLKGKIKSSDKIDYVKELEKENNTFNKLMVDNGYITDTKLKNGLTVKIAYMEYTSGNYIIIGMPRLFLTY